jgi:hypothetical protein
VTEAIEETPPPA